MFAKLRPWIGAACIAAPIFALIAVASSQAQPPNFPRMPGMPGFGGRGPGMPGMPGGGFGGMREYVYTCSHCGKEIARSPSPFTPNVANCPFCGVRFGNTMAGNSANMRERMQEQMEGMGGWNNGNPNPNTPEVNPPPVNPPITPPAAPPVFTPPNYTPAPFTTTPPVTTFTAPTRSGAGAVLIWVLVGIIGVLIFVALLGGAIWLLSTAPSMSSPAPRRRRRRPAPIIHP